MLLENCCIYFSANLFAQYKVNESICWCCTVFPYKLLSGDKKKSRRIGILNTVGNAYIPK